MRNKILTILIIGSLIFTIAYLPPNVKAFTNTFTNVSNGNAQCNNTCGGTISLTSISYTTLNDLLVLSSSCDTNFPISSITDVNGFSSAWFQASSDSMVASSPPSNIWVGGISTTNPTYLAEIWYSRVTTTGSTTLQITYSNTNTDCQIYLDEGNFNFNSVNNHAAAHLRFTSPATSNTQTFTTTIAPISPSSNSNYVVLFIARLQFAGTNNFNAGCPNNFACLNIIASNSQLKQGQSDFNYPSPVGGSGQIAIGYVFSTTASAVTFGAAAIDDGQHANLPIQIFGVMFGLTGTGSSNCSALVCQINEPIQIIESLGQLGNLVMNIGEVFHLNEFTNLGHSLLIKIADSFTFLEKIPLVGPIFAQQIKDSFRLLDSLCIITFSCSFVTFTQPTSRTYVLYDNPIDFFVTIFMIPAIAIIGIIFLMRRGAEIPEHMVMPLLLFAVLMIAWGGANTIFPASVSLLVILIAGAALSYYIADWFYGRFNKGAIETE